jgi:short-subunit dehydrogenase
MSRVIFITGASSGIGRATALAFAEKGDKIAGTARREDRLQALSESIDKDTPGEFLPLRCDVRDPAALEAAIRQVVEHFGRLDVLVANAGVGQRGSLIDSDWEDLETVMRTNMDGVLHTIRAGVPVMRRQGGGHIILVSSVVYNMTSPYAAIYAASKAFVSSIGRSLRLELEADDIKVTDMLVGRTESEFSKKRLGASGRSGGGIPVMSAEEVAQAVVEASESDKKAVAVRWFDRLLLLGNMLVPELIGRRALKQYK